MVVSIGANGLAKQIYPLIKNIRSLVFVDTTIKEVSEFNGHPVYPDLSEVKRNIDRRIPVLFYVSIGNPLYRSRFHDLLVSIGAHPITITGETACISSNSQIGNGNIVLNFCLIEWDVIIGKGNLINVGAHIFHDATIGNFNEIMPGAKILGGAKIGNMCRIGTNAVILPNIEICDNVVIGAGAVVTKNITKPGTYVGVPAKRR